MVMVDLRGKGREGKGRADKTRNVRTFWGLARVC